MPPNVSAFGRRLERVEDELFAEIDALKRRAENTRGQLLTDARMIADMKRRLADVEDWLEGRDPDDLPEFELLDELPPEKFLGTSRRSVRPVESDGGGGGHPTTARGT